MTQVIFEKQEIQNQIRNRFKERLPDRAERIRMLLLRRRWSALRSELENLKRNSKEYGFKELYRQSKVAQSSIPQTVRLPAHHPKNSHEATSHVLNTIDTILGRNSWVH